MEKITVSDFKPDGVTRAGDKNDMFYRFFLNGPQGGHFELLREPHHSDNDLKECKQFLKDQHDVVSIKVLMNDEFVNFRKVFQELGKVEELGYTKVGEKHHFNLKITKGFKNKPKEFGIIQQTLLGIMLRYPIIHKMEMDENIFHLILKNK